MKEHNYPVVIQVYLGSGKGAEKLRENLDKASGKDSLSEYLVNLMRKANPKLFKGVEQNG